MCATLASAGIHRSNGQIFPTLIVPMQLHFRRGATGDEPPPAHPTML